VEPRVRRVLHVDMDAFYASIEQRDDPALRGRPVAVGGHPQGRGVVAAASYEARRFGVRSAIPMSRALRLCPELAIVPADFERYRGVSGQVFEILHRVTPLVEPLSLDEAYLDVTENVWQEPLGQVVAQRIKAAIRGETGLTASAGVAPNKFLAKIASGWKKPDGLTVIAPEKIESFLQKLPVSALWGVGPKTAGKLRAIGIERLVDLRTCDPARLKAAVGSLTEWLQPLAQGIDPRPVEPHRERKSAGSENTYATDLTEIEEIRAEVARLTVESAEWLDRRGLQARTVTLKVRYGDFTTITRSHTRADPARDPADLLDRTRRLLERTEAGRRPVRLLGVSVHNLAEPTSPAAAPSDLRPRLPFPAE
jgi:DNA polymerase IV